MFKICESNWKHYINQTKTTKISLSLHFNKRKAVTKSLLGMQSQNKHQLRDLSVVVKVHLFRQGSIQFF